MTWYDWTMLMFLAWAIGFCFGGRSSDGYWANHGGKWKTPVHHRGKFYYVVPEGEYVEHRINPG